MIDVEALEKLLRECDVNGPEDVARMVLDLEHLDPIDLNSPVDENRVADAIVALAPEGAYVPLSQRYPWRFSEPTAGRQRADLLKPLIRLAALLEERVLVPGPIVEPGPCPSRLELKTIRPDGAGGTIEGVDRLICGLRATHAGMHQEPPRITEHGIVQGACWEDSDDRDVETYLRGVRDALDRARRSWGGGDTYFGILDTIQVGLEKEARS
jgi:hypothetical protein